MPEIFQRVFPSGLTLLAEPIPSAQSLAMSLLAPGGVALEPADKLGVAAMLSEIVCRGAGSLDAKAHCDALDQLGVHRSTGAGISRFRLGATMIHSKLPKALPLLIDMIRRPMLADAALEPSRDLALQALDSLEDEPQEKVFIELRRRHYPAPFGRSTLGDRAHLESMTIDDVRRFWSATMTPASSVIAFAGRFDWSELQDMVAEQLGDWKGATPEPAEAAAPIRGHVHQNAESTQVHIGLAYDALPEPDERSLLQRVASAVLSGGMSGRLFTEVREKRGLCYSVYATYAGQRERGAMLAYSGTTAPRAQETLDVLTNELKRVCEGVAQDEFDRAIVGMKSRLVMQGESTTSRAAAVASDQYTLGRPRTLEEQSKRVAAVTLADLNAFLAANKPGPMTVVTVGPAALKVG